MGVEEAILRHCALPAWEPLKEPHFYLCLSFPTWSRRDLPRGARPRPAFLSLPEFKLSPLPLRLGASSPAKAGDRGGGGCPGEGPGPLLHPSRGAPAAAPSAGPLYLCPVAGPVPPPC